MPLTLQLIFLLTLLPQVPVPKFEAQVLDKNVKIGYGLAIGDVDGDRKPDILLADQKQIVWYRNGDWQRFVMAENLTERDNVCIAARDIDGDHKVEVAVGAQWNPAETSDTTQSGAVFYLARPKNPTQRWEAIRLHHETTVHRMKWVQVAPKQFQLIVVPLHGRGNKDGQGAGVRVLSYHVPKHPEKEAWPYYLVDSTMHMTHNFEVLEDKGGTHIWLGGKEGVKVLSSERGKWKTADAQPWIQHNFGVGEVRRGYVGNQQVFVTAIEPMHGNQLTIYKPGDTNSRLIVKENMNQGHALACADLLGLGHSQIVTGWRNPNNEQKVGIRLLVSQDNTARAWQEYIIDDNTMACEDLQVADLNNDGKLDIIAAGRDSHNLIIYWNRSEKGTK